MIRLNYADEGIINSYGRKPINLVDPTPDMITIEDIAHALSNICRFGGHSKHFYSVAQHSVLVAHLAPADLKLVALLHDASEAYLGDVVKPLKHLLGQPYYNLECKFHLAIAERFGIKDWFTKTAMIKAMDTQAIKIEFEYLFLDEEINFSAAFGSNPPCRIPKDAECIFLSHFKTYSNLH